jgi:hypothetical protein
MNWYLHEVRVEADPVLVLFNCETRFQRSGYVNYQNKSFPILMHEESIHNNNIAILLQS